jgi:hypothetical protein
MGLTEQQIAYVLFYLGYSGFEDDGPAIKAINTLQSSSLAAYMIPIVVDLLQKLQDIRRDIHESRVVGEAISTGGVQTRGHYTVEHYWRIGRMYVTQLARFLKIAVYGDIFSAGGNEREPGAFYSGDPSENRINPSLGVPTTGEYGGPPGTPSGDFTKY